jgi:hypothetical protein
MECAWVKEAYPAQQGSVLVTKRTMMRTIPAMRQQSEACNGPFAVSSKKIVCVCVCTVKVVFKVRRTASMAIDRSE